MVSKVNSALETSMESLAPQLPRVEINDNNSGVSYFAPNVNDPSHAFDLYGHLLLLLNQDEGVPTIKVTQVSMQNEYGSSVTTLTGQAEVKFPLFAWFDKEVTVHSSVKIPHYSTSTANP
jgi:hypothetical protein